MIPKINSLLLIVSMASVLAGTSCSSDPKEESLETIKTEGKISQIIRNPVSADGTVDTVNVAKMKFEEAEFNFGDIKEGQVIKHIFKFTNTGKVSLLISNAKSTCGCTIPKWPQNAIEPGHSSEIAVEFNSSGKSGFQEKPVTITANTYPSTTRIFLRGFVNEAKQ